MCSKPFPLDPEPVRVDRVVEPPGERAEVLAAAPRVDVGAADARSSGSRSRRSGRGAGTSAGPAARDRQLGGLGIGSSSVTRPSRLLGDRAAVGAAGASASVVGHPSTRGTESPSRGGSGTQRKPRRGRWQADPVSLRGRRRSPASARWRTGRPCPTRRATIRVRRRPTARAARRRARTTTATSGDGEQRRRGHRDREVARVAGADEDAVEHEHHRGQRLHQRDDQQDLARRGARDRVVVGEERDERRGAARASERRRGRTPDGDAPLEHAAGRAARAPAVVGARGTGRRSPGRRSRSRRARARGTSRSGTRSGARRRRRRRSGPRSRSSTSEREQQRSGAHDEVAADDRGRRGSRRLAAGCRAPARPAERRTITRYAIAAVICATTVPHAEPAMPRSSPYTSSDLEREVQRVRRDRDHERGARVLQPRR